MIRIIARPVTALTAFACALLFVLTATPAFASITVTVELEDSAGAPLDGAAVAYSDGSWKAFGCGTTGCTAAGSVQATFPVDRTLKVRLTWGGKTEYRTMFVGNGSVYLFQTISACTSLKTSGGDPTADGVASYSAGSWYDFGTTDGTGKTRKELLPGIYEIRMTTLGTTKSITEEIKDDCFAHAFQTTKAVVTLKTCDPSSPLSGGVVSYSAGSWRSLGTTDGSGKASGELFAGTYNFRMTYNYRTFSKAQDIGAPVEFQTTRVALGGSGIQYDGGSWRPYTSPMNLLPGDYRFKINGQIHNVVVAGCNLAGGVLTLLDHNGNGLPGGMAQAACGGSWKSTQGPTDLNGKLFYTESCGITKIKMTYHQGGEEQTTAQMLASNRTWQTVGAVIKLLDHAGSGLAGGNVEQGGGYWDLLGYTDGLGELAAEFFPGNYTFRMTFNCTAQTSSGVNIASPVVFQTGRVVTSSCEYYSGCGWSGLTSGMELLPGSRNFKDPTTLGTVVAGVVNTIECPAAP